MSSFGDPRITYVNLPQNVGEQSGLHNHALQLARGDVGLQTSVRR